MRPRRLVATVNFSTCIRGLTTMTRSTLNLCARTGAPALKALTFAFAVVVCNVSDAQSTPPADAGSSTGVRNATQPTAGAKVHVTRKSAAYWRVTLDNP